MRTTPLVEAEREEEPLGVIVAGSLSKGLEMRMAETGSIEDLRVGKFVVVQGERNRFFAMLNDVQLGAAHSDFLQKPPQTPLAATVLRGSSTYTTVMMRPMLMVPNDASPDDEDAKCPVKTIPPHFSNVYEATQADVSMIFGDEERDPKFFHIGEPLDMETPVCLNLDRWVERSNAIFGKSGTGKTFLTRICLCGAIRENKAVHLIFDMHSEYGAQGTNEGGSPVYGLQKYFKNVKIYTLDPESSRRRKVNFDFHVRIPYEQIEVDDILLLQRELNLPATAIDSCYVLMQKLGKRWLPEFLKWGLDEIKEFVGENNVHQNSISALQRRLNLLKERCGGFLRETLPNSDDAVKQILNDLLSGYNVVLEFGQFDRPLQYMLVANILTRKIHDAYVELTERSMGDDGAKPKKLVIAIEEAHKFLAPHLAGQTIFGTIARELRKYNVTLLIVDQRPSGIDDEVLSQVGTKICCLLDDEKDIDAVLNGVSGATGLRQVLASLETKQQALIFGHAVPMPVVIKTRNYDDEPFRKSMWRGSAMDDTAEAKIQRRAQLIKDAEEDFA